MRFALLLPLIVLLASCDKQKQTAKKLSSTTWYIDSYKITDSEGLTSTTVASGTMDFGDCEQPNNCPYSINIAYTVNGLNKIIDEKGYVDYVEKGDYMQVKNYGSGDVLLTSYKYRILTRTKTDLQLEYTDSLSHTHSLIFKQP